MSGPHEVAGERLDIHNHIILQVGFFGLVFFHTRSLLIASVFKSKEIETADGIAVNDGLTQEVCTILLSADPVWLLQGSSQILVPVA